MSHNMLRLDFAPTIIVLSKLYTESFAGNNPGNHRQNEMRQRSQPTFLVTDEHAIRVVSHDGQVRTLAGKCGVAGFADTSSLILPVSSPTLFNGPHGIALLPRPAPEFAHATHSDVIAAAAASVVVCDINNHRLVVSFMERWKHFKHLVLEVQNDYMMLFLLLFSFKCMHCIKPNDRT